MVAEGHGAHVWSQKQLFRVRISCITVMPAKIKAPVCLAWYIRKLKVCVCTSFLQETKDNIDGVQLPKHINLLTVQTLHGTQDLHCD